jgi:TetR/AcrR family transcriptional regulator, transcriptional repressor for nem operon
MQPVKQPRAQITRDKILREATRLFTARGYHDTSLDDVLRASGVTTGAFFHHFRGKEQLGFAVLDWYVDRRREELAAIERTLPPADEPLERVFRLLDATQKRTERRARRRQAGCVFGNLTTSLSDTHDGFRRRLADCFDEMAVDFKQRLDAAAARHCPRRKLDTLALARYVVSVLEGTIILTRAHKDAGLIGRHFALLKDHLRRTIAT